MQWNTGVCGTTRWAFLICANSALSQMAFGFGGTSTSQFISGDIDANGFSQYPDADDFNTGGVSSLNLLEATGSGSTSGGLVDGAIKIMASGDVTAEIFATATGETMYMSGSGKAWQLFDEKKGEYPGEASLRLFAGNNDFGVDDNDEPLIIRITQNVDYTFLQGGTSSWGKVNLYDPCGNELTSFGHASGQLPPGDYQIAFDFETRLFKGFETAGIDFYAELTMTPASAEIVYVDDDAPVGGNGSSWGTAYNTLHEALPNATDGCEVHVAQGVYKPSSSSDPSQHFYVYQRGIRVRGGYAGLGLQNPDARDVVAYPTVLSGDLNGDDTPGFGNRVENSYNLLYLYEVDCMTEIDGFVFSGGNALGGGMGDGGAIRQFSFQSGPGAVVRNCIFKDNQSNNGGAVAVHSGSVRFENCRFEDNRATVGFGGAIDFPSFGALALVDCEFDGNTAMNGGGAVANRNSGSLAVTGSDFTNNATLASGADGGAVYDIGSAIGVPHLVSQCTFIQSAANHLGGALYVSGVRCDLVDCVFQSNAVTAQFSLGGAMYVLGGSNNPLVTLTNCEFSGNSAGINGGALNFNQSDPVIVGCTFTNNHVTQVNGTGGGAANHFDSSPLYRDCRFEKNSSATGGGAATCDYHSNAKFAFCEFRDNAAAADGGAIRIVGSEGTSNITAVNCRFIGNHAGNLGGAVQTNLGSIIIVGSALIANSAAQGGAMHTTATVSTTLHSTILANNATASGGGGGIRAHDFSSPAIDSCIYWNNQAAGQFDEPAQISLAASASLTMNNSHVQGLVYTAGLGNSDADPSFIDADGPDNQLGTADDNARLTGNSPCIDTGIGLLNDILDVDQDFNTEEPLPLDLDSNPRIHNRIVDRGAFEFQPLACPADSAPAGGNSIVDVDDLLLVINSWGVCALCPGDITSNGIVDVDDLLAVINAWGPCD